LVKLALNELEIFMKIARTYHDVIIRSIVGYAASVWCDRLDDVKQKVGHRDNCCCPCLGISNNLCGGFAGRSFCPTDAPSGKEIGNKVLAQEK